MKRPNGHYWVNKNGRWIVAEYDSNYGWYIPGREEVYEMNEFNLISNNPIIEPTAEANANTVLGRVRAEELHEIIALLLNCMESDLCVTKEGIRVRKQAEDMLVKLSEHFT